MIKTRHSGAKYSAIVGIGEKLRAITNETAEEILMLNRGINMVENIDIQSIIKDVDFNSNEIQVYPPVKGRPALRQAIGKEFFHDAASFDNIFITNGGVNALDLIFKTIDTEQVWLPEFYWGAYVNIMKINHLKFGFYHDLDFLTQNAKSLKGSTVMICDPNNPTGLKLDDDELLQIIRLLDENGVTIVFDSPYRRLFYDWDKDDFYKKLLEFENLIISESFSKSIGLSGQRIGFVHCTNETFMNELAINLLFATNGINNFAQILVEKILITEKGRKAAQNFRNITVNHIKKNIEYLIDRQLLANEIYRDQTPWGIFVIVKMSYETLLSHKIGSVPLSFFTKTTEINANNYARICVSVPHEKFISFFDRIII
jgi:aspartate/methionine/tyrosine aminotransferase